MQMMMKISKVHFLNKCLLVILLISLSGCAALKVEQRFIGFSEEGIHARGLSIQGEEILISGYNGHFTIVDFNGVVMYQDSIEISEDLRDAEFLPNGRIHLMNSGHYGSITTLDLVKQPGGYYQVNQMKYTNENVFLDGMDFWADGNGIAFGDPIENKLTIYQTKLGNDWIKIESEILTINNEAGFAASGTGIQCVGDSTVYIGTGSGENARIIKSQDRGKTWEYFETPVKSGGSYGIYSLFFWSENEGMVIGGSYEDVDYHEKICFKTIDGGKTWINCSNGLPGYMSCVQGNKDGKLIICTGRNATYYSVDQGEKWKKLSDNTYYTVQLTENRIVFSGKNGSLEILEYNLP